MMIHLDGRAPEETIELEGDAVAAGRATDAGASGRCS
jgi:hypothetical protein